MKLKPRIIRGLCRDCMQVALCIYYEESKIAVLLPHRKYKARSFCDGEGSFPLSTELSKVEIKDTPAEQLALF